MFISWKSNHFGQLILNKDLIEDSEKHEKKNYNQKYKEEKKGKKNNINFPRNPKAEFLLNLIDITDIKSRGK